MAKSYALCDAKINIFEGAVRSGKTVASILAWLEFVLHGPDGPLLMVGKTERTLIRNIIDPITEWLGPNRCKLVQGTGEFIVCGRKIYLVGANDAQSQDKIRGLTLVGAYVDEATTIPEDFFQMLYSRLSVPGARLIATTNPDNPMHWLMQEYLSRARLWITPNGTTKTFPETTSIDLARFSITLEDNRDNLPDGYIEDLEKQYTGLWRKRFVEGLWVQAEGAVYPMYDPAVHVVNGNDYQITDRLAVGIDPGTNHPFAAVRLDIAADPRGGELLIASSEYYDDSAVTGARKSDYEYVQAVISWLGNDAPAKIIVDSAAAHYRQAMHVEGLTTHLADKAVLSRIQLISSLLARRKLVIASGCPNLIKEFPAYVWSSSAATRGKNEPIKAHDDALDALGYAIKTTEHLWQRRL